MDSALPDLGAGPETFCRTCFRSLWQGGRCKRRDCASYAPTYLRDQAARIRANLAAWDGRVCLVTLTAPGRDVLPWDRSHCAPGEHRCSGARGCRVQWVEAADWNMTVTERLGELLKMARERVRRRYRGNAQVVVLAYVCEAQQRGVFHPHVVLGYRTAADRAALDLFRGSLKEGRGRYGFGTGRGSFDAGQPDRFKAEDAARYVSKYLRPDGAKASFVPLLERIGKLMPRNPETGRAGHLVRPVYVSTKLTKLTGVTMGFLRFKRFAWFLWRGRYDDAHLVEIWRAYRLIAAMNPLSGVRTAVAAGAGPEPPPVESRAPVRPPAWRQLRLAI